MPELTFAPVRDSKLQAVPEAAQQFNYGNVPALRHIILFAGEDKSTWERSIVEFDVFQLAGATVLAAKLVREITSLSNEGHQARISRCTRPGAWVESEVTWLRYRASSNWTVGGGDFDDGGPPAALVYTEPTMTGEHEVAGLLPFVEDALENRGGIVSLITRLADEGPTVDTGATWNSRESAQSWRLVVEFAPPDAGRRSIKPASRRPPAIRAASAMIPCAAARPDSPARRRR
jgi:hypothetical protein